MRAKHGQPQKFIEQALSHENDDCLIWPYGKFAQGYGQINMERGPMGAHRLVCIKAHGEPPKNHEVAHSCANRVCVNPRHLRWATSLENTFDRRRHGRAGPKLTEDGVLDICRRLDTGELGYKLAAEFNVMPSMISKIRLGQAWVWLTGRGT